MCDSQTCGLVLLRSTSSEIRLMLLPLCMGEVGSFVNVESQAKSAFESAQVGSEGQLSISRITRLVEIAQLT